MAEKEYIEREAVIEFGEQQLKRLDDGEAYRRLDAWLNSVPSADVRPVVWCKECKNWETGWTPRGVSDGRHYCAQLDLFPSADWFCADGEKREES